MHAHLHAPVASFFHGTAGTPPTLGTLLPFHRPRKAGAGVPHGTRWSWVTRCVDRGDVAGGDRDFYLVHPGDLFVAEVVSLGEHRELQSAERGRVALAPGQRIVVVSGNQYATDGFEGLAGVDDDGCDLLSGSGIAGNMRFAGTGCDEPTRLRPVSRLLDADGRGINISQYALPAHAVPDDTLVIGVFGATPGPDAAGVAAALARGLTRAGYDVAVVRANGNSEMHEHEEADDGWLVSSDFTDAGMASTYMEPRQRVERAFRTLVGAAAEDGAQVVIVEFGHGLLHRETTVLLDRTDVGARLDGALFAAGDAVGAVAGVRLLREHRLLPLAVSGPVADSPLAAVEAERQLVVPVCSSVELADGGIAREIIASAMRGEEPAVRAATRNDDATIAA